MRDEKYYFHQTPENLCKDIIQKINWDINEIVLEPFAGEDNFYNNIPEEIIQREIKKRQRQFEKNVNYVEELEKEESVEKVDKVKSDFDNIEIFENKK